MRDRPHHDRTSIQPEPDVLLPEVKPLLPEVESLPSEPQSLPSEVESHPSEVESPPSESQPPLPALLMAQEEALLMPAVRRSATALERLLLPEFCEFGSSGRVFDRASIVAALARETDAGGVVISRFRCERLGPEAALVTYTAGRAGEATSLRSSVWVLRDGRWQMLFHQGTRSAAPAA